MAPGCPFALQSPIGNDGSLLTRKVAACSPASTSTTVPPCALLRTRPLRAVLHQSHGIALSHPHVVTRIWSHGRRGLQARKPREALDEELLEEDFEDDMGGGLSEILSLVGFGFPAIILGGLWLFGQLPITLLVSLAVIPALQKAAGPAISGLWRMMNPPKRQPRQRWRKSQYQERRYPGGNSRPFYSPASKAANPVEETSDAWPEAPPGDAGESKLAASAQYPSTVAGWDQPVRQSGESTRARTRRRPSSASAPIATSRPATPLFLRVLLAVFPFLRTWGGFL